MATILKNEQRVFEEVPRRMDPYRLFTDVSRVKNGVNPENLNFDVRQLNPGQYSAPYHFHRFAEELFLIISGSATLRTPDGLSVVNPGDLMFFEKGATGAHQLFNHTEQQCLYLDIRTYFGYDVAEYPDSDKMLLAPSMEIFHKGNHPTYFEGEEQVNEKWNQLRKK
jgi:uncharacterized cupin superfamily protein